MFYLTLVNMNFLAVLSSLSLLLAAAVAQAPKPCIAPPLMNGGISMYSPSGLMMATGEISYDAFGQRMRVRSYGFSGNQTFTMDELMLFKEKVYYEINWSKFSCKKRQLSADFVPMQVPSKAQMMGQVFLGSSSSWGMGVLVNNWYGTMPGNGFYSAVFTEIGCIPMTISSYSQGSGWSMISTFNWVLGNSNPMDYHPPFFCAKAKLEETETPDNMFTVLESLATKTQKEA